MKRLFFLISIGLLIPLVFASCQKEVDVEIEPGYILISNQTDVIYSILIRNIDKQMSEQQAGKVLPFAQVEIPLEYGYTYELKAVEENAPGNPNTYNRTILVKPHVDMHWSLPNKFGMN